MYPPAENRDVRCRAGDILAAVQGATRCLSCNISSFSFRGVDSTYTVCAFWLIEQGVGGLDTKSDPGDADRYRRRSSTRGGTQRSADVSDIPLKR